MCIWHCARWTGCTVLLHNTVFSAPHSRNWTLDFFLLLFNDASSFGINNTRWFLWHILALSAFTGRFFSFLFFLTAVQYFLWLQLAAALWQREATTRWSHTHDIISQACANNPGKLDLIKERAHAQLRRSQSKKADEAVTKYIELSYRTEVRLHSLEEDFKYIHNHFYFICFAFECQQSDFIYLCRSIVQYFLFTPHTGVTGVTGGPLPAPTTTTRVLGCSKFLPTGEFSTTLPLWL